MDPEIQQRIIQKQATQIGNLMYNAIANEAQIEMLTEKLSILQAEKEALEQKPQESKADESPETKAE